MRRLTSPDNAFAEFCGARALVGKAYPIHFRNRSLGRPILSNLRPHLLRDCKPDNHDNEDCPGDPACIQGNAQNRTAYRRGGEGRAADQRNVSLTLWILGQANIPKATGRYLAG